MGSFSLNVRDINRKVSTICKIIIPKARLPTRGILWHCGTASIIPISLPPTLTMNTLPSCNLGARSLSSKCSPWKRTRTRSPTSRILPCHRKAWCLCLHPLAPTPCGLSLPTYGPFNATLLNCRATNVRHMTPSPVAWRASPSSSRSSLFGTGLPSHLLCSSYFVVPSTPYKNDRRSCRRKSVPKSLWSIRVLCPSRAYRRPSPAARTVLPGFCRRDRVPVTRSLEDVHSDSRYRFFALFRCGEPHA